MLQSAALPTAEKLKQEDEKKEKDIQDGEVFTDRMIPNYKEKMADVVAMLDKQNEIRQTAVDVKNPKEAKAIEQEARKAVNQKALDEVFTSFLNKEYQDNEIGDLEEQVQVDPLAFIEGEEAKEDEQDFYDYGELSDGDEIPAGSTIGMSQADKME